MRGLATSMLLVLLFSPCSRALRGSVLTCSDRKTSARVTLVGTVHFNPASIRLAETAVRDAAADGALRAVALESCPMRWNATMQQQPAGSVLRSLLDNEMQAAAEVADEVDGVEIVLVDQPIDQTTSRLVRLFGLTLVDLVTPWSGGWGRIFRDIRQGYAQVVSSGSAGPIDGGRRVLERALDPSLLAGGPVALGRYLLAFAVTSPALCALLIATTAYYAVYFGLVSGDGAWTAVTWSPASTEPIATVGEGAILVDARAFVAFQLVQWVVYARVFLVALLEERNRVIARNIRHAAERGGRDATVVAILGVAHLDGVRALLSEDEIAGVQ